MEHKNDCFVCGEELVKLNQEEKIRCYYCREVLMTEVRCIEGHFVCQKCHDSSALVLIERYCIRTHHKDPLLMAIELMHSPSIKMHGSEHHFLVPAVLLAAYYNYFVSNGQPGKLAEKEKKIREARLRAEKVSSGFCGYYGTCGAAIGTGIFSSLVTSATPLSINEWKLSNTLTAKCLYSIACAGGPRCCKRDSYIAITEAVSFANKELGVTIPISEKISCAFHLNNSSCLKSGCEYYPD